MKINKLRLLLALAGLLVTINSLKAVPPIDNREYSSYAADNLAFSNNLIHHSNFYNGTSGKLDTQEKAVVPANIRALENKVNDLTQQVKNTNSAVQQIKNEHTKLKKNNVEK